MSRRAFHTLVPLLVATIAAAATGCLSKDAVWRASADTDAVKAFADTLSALPLPTLDTPPPRRAPPPRPTPQLSPAAQYIAQRLVFFVNGQTWLTAAARRRHLVVDVGRVDATIRTSRQRRAYQEAVRAESPMRVGDRLRLHGPWGSDDAIVKGFGEVSGRIVATLDLPPALDSLARASGDSLVATATRVDSAAPPVVDSCPRDTLGAALASRLAVVSDSLQRWLAADTLHLSERLRRSVWARSSHAVGCFGPARVLLIVTLASAGYDYVREMAVLLDDAGRVTPIRMNPLRFKAHDVLLAFDADGDGVDDVAVKGRGERVGGTAVLRLDLRRRRLDFLTQGFAWEGY